MNLGSAPMSYLKANSTTFWTVNSDPGFNSISLALLFVFIN